MTFSLVKRITWDKVVNGQYLYGSRIIFEKDTVIFNNAQLASGKQIVAWGSRTNYQANRKIPELPLLVQGETYQLHSKLRTVPSNRLYLKIIFYNRLDEEIGTIIQREDVQEFVYPQDAFRYDILVISAGLEELVFKYIDLYRVEPVKPIKLVSLTTRKLDKDLIPDDLTLVKSLLVGESE